MILEFYSDVDEAEGEGDDELVSTEQSSSASSNADLRELCHLLNEERSKMHQLTEEWKQTSTRTIQKLEEQIGTYQEKLTLLEQRQIELVEENHSLKEQLDQRGTKKNKKKKKPSKDRQASPPPPITTPTRQPSVDDSLQQQISLQNMFDAIKTAEVYGSIDDYNESEKILLRDFCHLIWKYLQERSKPKSSCLL